ncbi:MAG: PhoH family protein, partial [Roseivivax sp.]|nr:PhoH family protein [Roseivivax sp.]
MPTTATIRSPACRCATTATRRGPWSGPTTPEPKASATRSPVPRGGAWSSASDRFGGAAGPVAARLGFLICPSIDGPRAKRPRGPHPFVHSGLRVPARLGTLPSNPWLEFCVTTGTLTESVLEFPNNRLLIDLCGEYDRNLTEIESRLGVQILRRGNRLAVFGDEAARAEAADVLTKLYQRLEAGRDVEAGDIDREFRMAAPVAEPEDQLEMFSAGKVEIKTRRKLVEPRTEAQKAYVRNLFANELCFGIGPAGTGKTYIAVAVGVNMLINGVVDRIILSRPAVEAGERLGFLPGDM